jgi:simple sugar transport system ATP-binding protein
MRGITKRFPGVVANDTVDFRVARGEMHALLGENGAGKTTLMHILYGMYQPDAGDIYIYGQRVHLRSSQEAMAQGISMVHQHFMLVPVMTVAENIILGREETYWGGLLARQRAIESIRRLAQRYHLEVDPQALVQDVSVGVRQRVEILKALYRQAQILILDEPTAVLAPNEAEHVFHTLRALAQQGTAIIFITHKLADARRLAHRLTVLRQGRVVCTTTPAEITDAQLAQLMVGDEVSHSLERRPYRGPPDVVLQLQDVQVLDQRRLRAVQGVSLTVHAGEILGLAGVQGNGQTELIESLSGLRAIHAGVITIQGVDVTRATPRQLATLAVAHIPEDRHTYGLVETYSIADNLTLTTYDQLPFARGLMRCQQAIVRHARHLMQAFAIRAPAPDVMAGSLSGGNQQKLVVARACAAPRCLLIAAQPTRGLDVAAATFVQQQLLQQRAQGCAVLLVSTDLDEILVLSDRIAVMYQGQIVAMVAAHTTTRADLGRFMTGLR